MAGERHAVCESAFRGKLSENSLAVAAVLVQVVGQVRPWGRRGWT